MIVLTAGGKSVMVFVFVAAMTGATGCTNAAEKCARATTKARSAWVDYRQALVRSIRAATERIRPNDLRDRLAKIAKLEACEKREGDPSSPDVSPKCLAAAGLTKDDLSPGRVKQLERAVRRAERTESRASRVSQIDEAHRSLLCSTERALKAVRAVPRDDSPLYRVAMAASEEAIGACRGVQREPLCER